MDDGMFELRDSDMECDEVEWEYDAAAPHVAGSSKIRHCCNLACFLRVPAQVISQFR